MSYEHSYITLFHWVAASARSRASGQSVPVICISHEENAVLGQKIWLCTVPLNCLVLNQNLVMSSLYKDFKLHSA